MSIIISVRARHVVAAVLATLCLLGHPLPASPQEDKAAASTATARMPSDAYTQVFQNPEDYSAKYPSESRWMDGGDRYTVLEPSIGNAKAMDLVVYDTATGKRAILVAAKQLTPAGAQKPLEVEDYSWSEDKRSLLIFTNSKRMWRRNTLGDYWVLTPADGRLKQLGAGAPASSLMFAKFSPDGRSVAYVRENNLYSEDVASGKVLALTNDGSASIINGTSDWVNEEELSLRDAFRWSPDSKSIAYWQFDESGVEDYTLINDTEERYPQIRRYKYPQVGTTNSAVRVGIVSAGGGPTRWVQLPGDSRNHYIPRMDWVGDGDRLTVEQLNRLQNDDRIYLVDGQTGTARLLFEEKDPQYLGIVDFIDEMPNLKWMPARSKTSHDRNMLWLSERDGWRHAYLVSLGTGEPRLITHFDGDVIALAGTDAAAGYLYFVASPGDPVRSYLYRSRLDGTGTAERVTPAGITGRSGYDASPNGEWAIRYRSSASDPPTAALVRMAGDTQVRVLEDNAALRKKMSPVIADTPREFLETPVSGGARLSTFVVKPPHFDPARKYPVVTYIYGEPAGATVKDNWESLFLATVMAREGYVAVSFDNAGTPEPKGRAWRQAGYGEIGVLSTQQQAEAIREFAKEHPWVDTTRMAIWGWSGGGTNTLNMIFRNPGLYSTAVAVAPVPDQTRYDTIYQERYMGLPKENAKGYHDGSAINFASGLSGHLLIIHGSGDDNVHFQGTELLVNKLIELGKPFDFMDYPNRSHGIYEGKGTTPHLYNLIMRYIEEHVPAGPR